MKDKPAAVLVDQGNPGGTTERCVKGELVHKIYIYYLKKYLVVRTIIMQMFRRSQVAKVTVIKTFV